MVQRIFIPIQFKAVNFPLKIITPHIFSSYTFGFPLRIMMTKAFVIYSLYLGFFIPFNFLPDLAKDLKLEKTQGALLISIIGVSNTVARLLVGFITDRPWANSLVINNLALMIGGVTTFAVPFYNSFAILVIYSIVFGASIGLYIKFY